MKKITQILLSALFAMAANTTVVYAANPNELKEISSMAEKGQAAAALDKLNAYLASNANDAQAMFLKGIVLVELNKREEAIKAFTELSEKYPNLPEPYNNLAVLYADSGQYDKARKALETAIKTHPSYATAHENLGDIYARMASEAYDKALQLDNSNARAQNKLALIKDLFDGKTPAAKTVIAAKPEAPISKPAEVVAANKPAPSTSATLPIRPAEKPVAKPVEKKPEPIMVEENQETKALDTVNRWATAWSSQKVDDYLAFYADSFKPTKGQSRKEWANTRRERVSRPKSILVEVLEPVVKLDGDKAEVKFKQRYTADGKPQSTAKTLLMKKQGDTWMINQEIAAN